MGWYAIGLKVLDKVTETGKDAFSKAGFKIYKKVLTADSVEPITQTS